MAPSILDKTVTEVDSQPTQVPPKEGKGCLFWGCTTAAVLAVIVAAVVGIGAYRIASYVKGFTSETPAEIPVYQPAAGEYESVKAKIEAFKTAVENGTSGAELVLTGNDINTMISSEKDWEQMKGSAYITIVDDKISVEVSFPLDEVPGFSGRYLNGSAGITVSMELGILEVKLDHLEVNGELVPDEFMKVLQNENLAKGLYDNPEAAELIKQVQDLRVEDGKLILISK